MTKKEPMVKVKLHAMEIKVNAKHGAAFESISKNDPDVLRELVEWSFQQFVDGLMPKNDGVGFRDWVERESNYILKKKKSRSQGARG